MTRHDISTGIMVMGKSLAELRENWLIAKEEFKKFHRHSKRMINYETKQEFNSIMELSEFLGVNYFKLAEAIRLNGNYLKWIPID